MLRLYAAFSEKEFRAVYYKLTLWLLEYFHFRNQFSLKPQEKQRNSLIQQYYSRNYILLTNCGYDLQIYKSMDWGHTETIEIFCTLGGLPRCAEKLGKNQGGDKSPKK